MDSLTTPTRHTSVAHRSTVPAIAVATAFAAAVSAAINAVLRQISVAALDIPQPQYQPLDLASVVISSALSAVAGGAFFAILTRFTSRPFRLFLPVTAAVLALSMIPAIMVNLGDPPQYPGAGVPAMLTLMVMHVVVAATLAAAMSRTRRAPAAQTGATRTSTAKRPPYGRLLLSGVALVAAITPYLADWNHTHVYNPAWPPHAKFHVGHTMLLGTVLGLLSLFYLWRRAGDRRENLRTGALIAASYWVAQAGAVTVPGSAVVDPQFADRIPTIAGMQLNQVVLDAILVALALTGYLWQRARQPQPVA
ncbi:MAG TPA: DUF6640 family protein [Candidatus Limnocylindrales bacterium]